MMALENKRIFLYSLLAAALVVWYVIWRFLGSLLELVPTEYTVIGGFSLTYLLGPLAFILAAVAMELTRRDERANKFGLEVIAELKKVTWPTWKDIRGSTFVVLVMTFVVSMILFIFDKIFDFFLTLMW